MAAPGPPVPRSLTLTIDTSVFVAAAVHVEAAHAEAVLLLERCAELAVPLVLPTFVRPEIAGALVRRLGDPNVARSWVEGLARAAHARFVPLDDALADDVVDVAIARQLRGAGAVYVAVARRFGALLVSEDIEQRHRAAGIVQTLSAADALRQLN